MIVALGLVTAARVELCPYCRKPVAVVEVRNRDARWTQPAKHHECVRTVLSDLVDAKIFGDGGL